MTSKTDNAPAFDHGAQVRATTKSGTYEGTVTGYQKGWYEITCPDGTVIKARESQLDHAPADGRKMSQILAKYRAGYHEDVSYSGKKTQNTGDELAEVLRPLSPNDVCLAAEIALSVDGDEPGWLMAKYESLNPGQIRMNSGNRLRAAIKRRDITLDNVKAAMRAMVKQRGDVE
jgi:hypothetical protein